MDNAEVARQHDLCTCGHSHLVHLVRCCISRCKCNHFEEAEVARPSDFHRDNRNGGDDDGEG